jgi:energy-coupling factor transporter transmembrane protein EcfT
MVLLTIAAVIIWVAIAFWPARVAGRKGHSFLGYFVLSLFFFPLSLIMAYVVEDRTRPVSRPRSDTTVGTGSPGDAQPRPKAETPTAGV